MSPTVKTCFKCHAEKPITEFYVHPQMGDGRLNKCKDCTKRDVAENYRKNIEHYVAYERDRSQRPERKAKSMEYARNGRERSPEKNRARQLVAHAVRSGKLVAKPCEVCGSTKVHGHHDDYSKPLDVRWLCWAHHMEVHQKMAYADEIPNVRKAG